MNSTGVTVRKRPNWGKISFVTSVTLTFGLWPWPFVWTSLLSMVITHENLVMIPWEEYSGKCGTDVYSEIDCIIVNVATQSSLWLFLMSSVCGCEECCHPIGLEDGQAGGRTDRRTDRTVHWAAWSQLKMKLKVKLVTDTRTPTDTQPQRGTQIDKGDENTWGPKPTSGWNWKSWVR